MTQEQIDGNKAIAEFMGFEYDGISMMIKTGDLFLLSLAKYHSSWDWQIPVWGKVNLAVKDIINKAINKKPGLYHTGLKSFLIKICNSYNNAVFQNKPEEGQKIIVESIQFYNSQLITPL